MNYRDATCCHRFNDRDAKLLVSSTVDIHLSSGQDIPYLPQRSVYEKSVSRGSPLESIIITALSTLGPSYHNEFQGR